jgi:hypothetical protein
MSLSKLSCSILYDQFEQAMSEANNATRHAFQETFRRGKAEKDAIEAIRRVIIMFLYIMLWQK